MKNSTEFLFSRTADEGYTHRVKFAAYVDKGNMKDEDPFCFDIFTNNTNRGEVLEFIKGNVASRVTRLEITYWTTKECDDIAGKMIDEMMK